MGSIQWFLKVLMDTSVHWEYCTFGLWIVINGFSSALLGPIGPALQRYAEGVVAVLNDSWKLPWSQQPFR